MKGLFPLALLAAAALPACAAGRAPAAPGGRWLTFYGSAAQMGDLALVARRFDLVVVDADPGLAPPNFTAAQLAALKAGGARVLSYLNAGACEAFRDYYGQCMASGADLGPYEGYEDERWMNPAVEAYRQLLLDVVAPRLVAQGVDGLYLDNLEVVERGGDVAQGGLDLVYALREKYPGLFLVMQNATGPQTRLGASHGVPFPALLDGVAHEEVWLPTPDPDALAELRAWSALARPEGRALWIGTLDYAGACPPLATPGELRGAQSAAASSRALGFHPYVSDASSGQERVCVWPF